MVVAVGGDSHRVWRVITNVLNKQLKIADKRWSSNLGVGCEADNPSSLITSALIQCHTLCQTWNYN